MASAKLRTGHVGLNVTDIDRSIAFYTRVFGFEVLREGAADAGEGRRFAFLGRDGELAVTLWQQAGSPYDGDRSGLHHLAFEVDRIQDVRAAEAVLRSIGADFHYEGVVPHGQGTPSGGVFFHDPDGIRLELFAPSGAEGLAAPVVEAPTCGFF
ncbi:VOC family protein [Streptomyces sp. NPDC057654]|uniref:VOC family protein n=1 Tax=Streptomyces sp. NPDC057654 TaxID=3346196 RepID=UPI0036A67149